MNKIASIRKGYALIMIVLISVLISGFYGIVHDQITYTIAPEYYTKFKFIQFGLIDHSNALIYISERSMVSIVGFLATWWVGLIIGVIYGIVGLRLDNGKQMLFFIWKVILSTILITILAGVFGCFVGMFIPVDIEFNFQETIENKRNFIIVGTIHNLGYIGGFLGLIIGVIRIFREKKGLRAENKHSFSLSIFSQSRTLSKSPAHKVTKSLPHKLSQPPPHQVSKSPLLPSLFLISFHLFINIQQIMFA